MRREMGAMKKQLEEVQGGKGGKAVQAVSTESLPTTQLAPIQPIQPIAPSLVDAEAEEYIEPVREPENLNLNDLSKTMLEKALERNHGNRVRKPLPNSASATEHYIADSNNMDWISKYIKVMMMTALALIITACSVSYKFNGASIDYSKTKTIQIVDFPIRSSYVWGPMGPMFNNQLKDEFASHTKLIQVKRNGDLKIEGEITRYEQRNKSVTAEGSSSMVELSMTVNVRYTNNKDHEQDFEQQFTAQQSFDSKLQLNSVQEGLVQEMVKDIVQQIFNATVANW